MNDNEVKVAKNRVWAGALITGSNTPTQQIATDLNLYPDSVPCRGGNSDIESAQSIPNLPENNQIQGNKELDAEEIIRNHSTETNNESGLRND